MKEVNIDIAPYGDVLSTVKEWRAIRPTSHRTLPSYDAEIVSDERAFLSLRSEWNALVDRAPVHIYQTFDWMWLWWKHYGGNNTLHIVTLRSAGSLAAIIPLFVQNYTIGRKILYSRLRLMGSGIDGHANKGLPSEYGPSDYLDMIALPEFAPALADAFAEVIQKNRADVDEIQFSDIRKDGMLYRYCLPIFRANNYKIRERQGDVCPYLIVPKTMDEFIANLGSSARHRVRQAKKEFDHNPPFSIETIQYVSDFRSALKDLVTLHQIRWNRLGYAGLFADSRFVEFQTDVLYSFYDQGILWFKAVRFNGIRTAARLGFMFKNRVYDYLSGFDETLPKANKRPNLALLSLMINDAIDQNMEIVDLLRGDESYKHDLTRTEIHTAMIRLFPERGFSLRRSIYRIAHVISSLVRRCADEWTLLMIHKRMQGPKLFLGVYGKFVWRRIRQKLSGILLKA